VDRRAFLSILAGSPFVFGLREILAQEGSPDFVNAALKRMKATKRFGVLLVIPADKVSRMKLGQALLDRLAVGSDADRKGFDLFCAHVFVCLSDEQAAKAGLEAKVEGEGVLRLLLDPQGKRIEADRVKLGVIQDPGKFAESFTAFIHGEKGARLRDHAKAIEKEFTPELKKAAERLAVGRLDGTDGEAADAYSTFVKRADTITPWLLQKKLEDTESKYQLILWEFYMHKGPALDPEPVMPFGIRAERGAVGDPCPPCGMAAYRATSYRFLSFFAR
jgi:hypothetical protein